MMSLKNIFFYLLVSKINILNLEISRQKLLHSLNLCIITNMCNQFVENSAYNTSTLLNYACVMFSDMLIIFLFDYTITTNYCKKNLL